MNRRRIVDTFPFAGSPTELLLLECRLTELYDTVDAFVIVEAEVDHQDHPKPLNYLDNVDRFAAWKDKIVYVLANDYSVTASLAIADEGQNLRITWPALAGLNYWVDYKSNLTALDWMPIAQVVAPDGLGIFTQSNRLGSQQGYFRIRLPNQQP